MVSWRQYNNSVCIELVKNTWRFNLSQNPKRISVAALNFYGFRKD